ncbi:MAG: polysaccharide biosynthesis C-terminal domain-containing protein [Ignavibacteriae bacterium]|nr:polysaccharide biosynthesis C-terminal domain-containing protein [Ignavibacteriota bacterium]
MSILINIVFSIILVQHFRAVGLALGTSISTFFLFYFTVLFIRKLVNGNFNNFLNLILKVIIGLIVMLFVFYVNDWLALTNNYYINFSIGSISGFGFYIFTLIVLKNEELTIILNKLKIHF